MIEEERKFLNIDPVFSKVERDFKIVLSEIEKAYSERFPHSRPVRIYPPDKKDEGDLNTVVFTWTGVDKVDRNIQLIIDDVTDLSTSPFSILIHAWRDLIKDDTSVRIWQHKEIASGLFNEFWSDNLNIFKQLESAYAKVSEWESNDLTRKTDLV